MATNNTPQQTSTGAKIALGTSIAALVGGLLGAFGSSNKKPPAAKPMGKCGACGR